MENQPNFKKNFFSEWLEKLQQESWQLELLISGLALFGIYASDQLILSFDYYIQVNSPPRYDEILAFVVSLLWASRAIFLVNLLLHIMIRGFWIGAIGLRYVSGDIDYDELNYSERFTKFYQRKIGSFDKYIEKLENFSSILFSYTFLLFFLLLSFFAFNFFVVLIVLFFSDLIIDPVEDAPRPIGILIIFLYYFFAIIVFIDFLSLGIFKKIKDKTISRIYMWIYRFYSTVSLSFLYRPILLNFIDDKYTRRLFFLSIPYVLFLGGMSGVYLERHSYFPSFDATNHQKYNITNQTINYLYYDDLRSEHYESLSALGRREERQKIAVVSLSEYEISNDVLKFFIEYRQRDNRYLTIDETSIHPFRKSDIRHTLLNNHHTDPGLEKINQDELAEIKAAASIARNGVQTKLDSSIINKYGPLDVDLDRYREDIRYTYNERKKDYVDQKYQSIKDEMLNLCTITVNGVDIAEDFDSKFYIHPNMLEKGILCYYNIDSLSFGEHSFSIKKRGLQKMTIPFRKIKQNQ